jgi:hypothetical protein
MIGSQSRRGGFDTKAAISKNKKNMFTEDGSKEM